MHREIQSTFLQKNKYERLRKRRAKEINHCRCQNDTTAIYHMMERVKHSILSILRHFACRSRLKSSFLSNTRVVILYKTIKILKKVMAKMINRVIAKMLIENEKERSARTKDENDFRCYWYLKVNNKYSQV